MPLDLDYAIKDFLRFKGMAPNAPVSDEAAFYGEFAEHVFGLGAGNRVRSPGREALYGGFLRAKGIAPNTPVAPGGEQAFYSEFISWVYDQGAAVPLNPKPDQGRASPAPWGTKIGSVPGLPDLNPNRIPKK